MKCFGETDIVRYSFHSYIDQAVYLPFDIILESTGRAIAVTSASALALASALLKMLKFLVKVFIRLYLLNMLMD